MRVTKRQRGGEVLVSDLVRLVRATYADDSGTQGDGRGLVRLEHALSHGSTKQHQQQRPASSSRGWFRLAVAGAAAVAIVSGGVVTYQRYERLTYQVMNGAVGPEGLVRPTAPGTAIVFSEGSEITLGDSTRARVEDLTADGGRVVLESGSVKARIVPRKRARWLMAVGPYTIRVTGTAFKVKWSWADERMDIHMDHGSVIVTGPLAPAGITLTAGMELSANPASGLALSGGGVRGVAPAAPTAGPAKSEVSGTESEVIEAEARSERGAGGLVAVGERRRPVVRQRLAMAKVEGGVTPSPASSAPPTSAPRHVAAPGLGREPWDRQLARGDVDGILADADGRGIDSVLVTASGRELSALADAARYGHRPALARRVLLSVRERFPRSAESRDAAFFLGALAEDTGPADGERGLSVAREWYDRYLQENGHGRYAAQALGRKMVITQKLRGLDAARPVATEYLNRFPGGPYASVARRLLRARY